MNDQRQQTSTRDKTVYRCTTCGKPLMVGDLSKGSEVTLKCHNRKCASQFTTIIAAS